MQKWKKMRDSIFVTACYTCTCDIIAWAVHEPVTAISDMAEEDGDMVSKVRNHQFLFNQGESYPRQRSSSGGQIRRTADTYWKW